MKCEAIYPGSEVPCSSDTADETKYGPGITTVLQDYYSAVSII